MANACQQMLVIASTGLTGASLRVEPLWPLPKFDSRRLGP